MMRRVLAWWRQDGQPEAWRRVWRRCRSDPRYWFAWLYIQYLRVMVDLSWARVKRALVRLPRYV